MHIGFYFVASYIDTVNVQIVDIGFCFVARQATTTIFVTVRLQARRQNSVSTSSALPFVNIVDIVIFVNFVDIVNFVNIVIHNCQLYHFAKTDLDLHKSTNKCKE